MNKEKMLERHNEVVEKINNATNIKELPSITLFNLKKCIANNIFFDKTKLKPSMFDKVVDARFDAGTFADISVCNALLEVLQSNYPGKTMDEYMAKYQQLFTLGLEYIIEELYLREAKINEFKKAEFVSNHASVMKQIEYATSVKELPSVSMSDVTKIISSDAKTTSGKSIDYNSLKSLVRIIVDNNGIVQNDDVETELFEKCKSVDFEHTNSMYDEIMVNLINDYRIPLIIEEVKYKERRKLEIYKQEHDFTMQCISDATRISELPTNLSLSTITSYLSSNSVIYPKQEKIPASEFVDIANYLLSGKKFSCDEINSQIDDITFRYFADNQMQSFILLKSKLSQLPRLDYYVEEVKYSKERQEEFILRGSSNVYSYMVPNPKSPMDGGKFYNIYISRVKNLDLEEILPLDLDNIVPEGMDIDSIEWYVREKYDKTFKLAGGLIVNRDETIGNVKVFKPSDGKVGITPQEKTRYEELKQLSTAVKELMKKQQEELKEIEERISALTEETEAKVKKYGTIEE